MLDDEFLVRTVRLPATKNVAICVFNPHTDSWKYFFRNNYKTMARARSASEDYIAHQSRFHDQNDG